MYEDRTVGAAEQWLRQGEVDGLIAVSAFGCAPDSTLLDVVQRAARVLGLLTGELGLSVGPILAEAVLLKLDFVPIDSGKALMVLTLDSGEVETVVYGWDGDDDRDRWLEYDHRVRWSYAGGPVVEKTRKGD